MSPRTLAVVVAAALSVPTAAFAQAAPSPLDGVWRIAEVITTGANASTESAPQPSLVIFARGHYSYVSINGGKPRPAFAAAKDPAKLTDAERVARFEQWSPFTANAGTFQVKGATLTRRPTVAKNEGAMTGPGIVQDFKIEGPTLWLISKSAAGQPASETRLKLTRVQ